MNIKKMIGAFLFVLGIIMAIYAIHSMGRIKHAKESINQATGLFGDRKEAKFANKALTHEASQYDRDVMILLIAGIVFVVVGSGLALFSKKKK